MEQQGVVVLSGVMRPQEVEAIRGLMWDWLEGYQGESFKATGVDRHDLATWTVADGKWPEDHDGTGVVSARGAAQSAAAWEVRGAPAVQRVFRSIWGTDELISSMDALVLWRPWRSKPAAVTEPWRTRSSWLHLDHNVGKRPRRECVQGLLLLTPAEPERTGGFVCVPGSHQPGALAALCERLERQGRRPLRKRGDFLDIPAEDPLQGAVAAAASRPGDLVLWDSRVAHCSEAAPGCEALWHAAARTAPRAWPPQQQRPSLLRMAVPVCMVPRAWAEDPAALRAWRLDVVRRGLATKHWPLRQRLGCKDPPVGVEDYVPPTLSEAMLRVL